MIPLIAVVAALRDLGVDVDPSDVFARMFLALSNSSDTKSTGVSDEDC